MKLALRILLVALLLLPALPAGAETLLVLGRAPWPETRPRPRSGPWPTP